MIAVTKCLINMFTKNTTKKRKGKVNKACIFILKKKSRAKEKSHKFCPSSLFFYKKHGSYFFFNTFILNSIYKNVTVVPQLS
jgi:hypothetical protein